MTRNANLNVNARVAGRGALPGAPNRPRLADHNADVRMVLLAGMGAVRVGAAAPYRVDHQPAVVSPAFVGDDFAGRGRHRPAHHHHPGSRQPRHRGDGTVRLGQDPRPWHSRSDRGDPLRRQQTVAQGRDAEAAVVGDLDRHRRAVRRRGADHHDRRGDRLAVRAASSTSPPPSARRCWWRARPRA